MRIARIPALLVIASVWLAACGGDAAIRVEGAWARPSPQMAEAGAVYLRLTAPDGDRLLSAAVDPGVGAATQIHETVMEEGAQAGMGAMTMHEIGSLDLPAGETVSLEPGGLHIMVIGLVSPLEDGVTFDVTLTFEVADPVTVEVEVREEEP